MGLFDKKYCSVCNNKIGLLGNRKLEDGNLCKDCAKKLSPWFDERRHSTVDQIKEQLAYREENQNAVQNFHTTRTYGNHYVLHLDENQRKFMVVRTKDVMEENPDVIDFSQVTSCELKINEMTREDMREEKDADGKTKRVSYVPPRYIYSYDFTIKLRVNHTYFDEISFKLNDRSVEIVENGRPAFGRKPGLNSIQYHDYENMGNEIKQILMQRDVAAGNVAQSQNESSMRGTMTMTPTCFIQSAMSMVWSSDIRKIL